MHQYSLTFEYNSKMHHDALLFKGFFVAANETSLSILWECENKEHAEKEAEIFESEYNVKLLSVSKIIS